MSRHYLIASLVVGLLALGGWALAQQERPGANGPAPEGEQFIVSSPSDIGVLLESKSGRTWVLHHSVGGDPVWLPAQRIDSEEDSISWRQREHQLKQARIAEQDLVERRALGEELARIEDRAEEQARVAKEARVEEAMERAKERAKAQK